MELSLKEILSAFMVLFAIIDITGSIPVILGLKEQGNKIEAGKISVSSFLIFILFQEFWCSFFFHLPFPVLIQVIICIF